MSLTATPLISVITAPFSIPASSKALPDWMALSWRPVTTFDSGSILGTILAWE